MRDRIEPILKIVCLALAAFLVYRLVSVAIRSNPLARMTIPAVPTLSPDTNAPAAGKATNAAAPREPAKQGTNVSTQSIAKAGTNAIASSNSAKAAGAGVMVEGPPAADSTNRPSASGISNLAMPSRAATNPVLISGGTTQRTTIVLESSAEKSGTNPTAAQLSVKGDTNTAARLTAAQRAAGGGTRPDAAMMAMGGSRPGGAGGRPVAPELPPAVKARVYRVYDSEILGPIMRPLPMALLGIAGDTAFLRAPNGQTGLVKTNGEVGGLKLLQIGVNRVLVEQDGKKEELTIFNGYGGESLLPK